MIDANESNTKEKTLFEKRGLSMFSSIMTAELQNEMSQLLTEQQNYQLEIIQLKKERNFLFKLLKKQSKIQKENSLREKRDIHENQNLKFSFCHQEQISIPPIGETKSYDSDQFPISSKHDESGFNSSNFASDKKYLFSKNIFLDEIKKYSEIPLFERFSEIIELSQNGDSMVSYFVNTVGDAFIAYELQIKKLREDLCRIKNKQRKAFINSVESLTESKKPDIEILTNIIESYDFNEEDDSILSDLSQNFDLFSNSDEIADRVCIDMSKESNLNQSILASNCNIENNKPTLDDLDDYNIYF